MSTAPDPAPRTAAELLAFANVKDVDDFIEGLRKFESGEWTPDQFKLYRLNRGTYGQRQADVNMLRIKFPVGAGTADQLDAVADVCEQYSRGFAHVTTRQNFQVHFLKLKDAPAAQLKMAAVGLTTKEACGNTVRNVTGCAMAGCCGGEAFDVTAYGHEVTRHFLRRAQNQSLPRKFKIAFSGCGHDCGYGAINDVGLLASIENGVRGFKVKVAGGLSTTPEDAHTLYDFLPTDRLLGVIEALVAVFDKHGNRQNKSRARLKYVVRKHGFDGFKALFEKELAEVAAAGHAVQPIDPAGGDSLSRAPSLPLAGPAPAPSEAFARWRASNVQPQKQKGFVAATVRLIRGDITAKQLRGVAQLARTHGDAMVRLTIDQNLLMRFVSETRLAALHAGLAELGLAEADAATIADVTSCPGAESCNLAVTSSRELASSLTAKLQNANGATSAVAAAKDLNIKISGCPNSCGQHHIAGIGFHGGMRRVGGRVVPEYTLHLGGAIDEKGAVFGRQLVRIPARRAADVLIELLHLYENERQPGEKALAFFQRVTPERVKAAVAELTRIDEQSARPEDFLDLGDSSEFVVATGDGECAV